MAMKITTEGGAHLANIAMGAGTRPTNWTLALITDANAAAITDTYANSVTASTAHTLAAGGGYAAISLAAASGTAAVGGETANVPQISWAQQTFTFTGALTGNATITGYMIYDITGTKLIAVEKTTSFTPANNGDTYKVTPIVQFGNGTPGV